MIDTNLYNELKDRGLLYQCSDEESLKKKLESGEPIVVYEGSDPTADSLHIGHCVPYCVLRRFQKAGHKVILLMGGFDKGLDLQEMSTYNSHIKKLVTFGAAGKRFKEDMHHQDAYYEETLKDAVNKAFEISEPGDIILLSPSTSSFDEFKGYEERGRIFKQYVNEK